MKYFAKYVHTGGEIKPSDKVIYNNLVRNVVGVIGVELLLKDFAQRVWTDECKKVKLFLCSKDIHIGDTIINPITLEEFTNVSSGQLQFAGNFIKKIGEISLTAKWVKEGYAFKEDEVRRVTFVECFFENARSSDSQYETQSRITPAISRYTLRDNEELLKEIIEIKGRCGYFH